LKKSIKIIFVTFGLLVSFGLGAAVYFFSNNWLNVFQTREKGQAVASRILDCNGVEIASFSIDKQNTVSYADFSPLLIKGFIAAEDHSFFSHSGISLRGIARSLLVNIYHGRYAQGASTITQQVVRLLYLSPERSLFRKIKEIILALQLESSLTKQQILELYLNNIYFGRGIYGVEAASQRFWGKSSRDLTIEEVATLASVAKSANYYSPLNAPLAARKRRDIILKSMFQQGFITKDEYLEKKNVDLVINEKIPGNPMRLYIQEWVRMWAEGLWGRDALYKDGLVIKTTIDLAMQNKAEQAFKFTVNRLRVSRNDDNLNGALVSLDPPSGKIVACVAGYDFNQSQFNRVFKAVRQTGSIFKPILYSAALMQGLSMRQVMRDEPLEIPAGDGTMYRPRNWHREHEGDMTLLRALTTSNNIIAIKTLQAIGYEPVISLAKEFGLSRTLHPYPSLALGIAEGTLIEAASAFNVFANHGEYVKPYLVESVRDSFGKVIWEHKAQKHRVLDSKLNSRMVNALSLRMLRSNTMFPKEQWLNVESIGKTGSTNNATTTWFVGATPDLTTAVYVGRDDNKPLGEWVYGSQTSYPIWFNYYKSLSFKEKHFYLDPSLKESIIDWSSGKNVAICNDHDYVRIVE
jgi:penicillin-binding protein 1A